MNTDDPARRTVIDVLLAEVEHPVEAPVTDDTPLAGGGLALSSLEIMRALIRIEDTLDADLDEVIAEFGLKTVGDVVDAVRRSLPAHAR